MLEFFCLMNNFYLIFIIFARMPQDTGLSTFTRPTQFLGSPRTAQRILDLTLSISSISHLVMAFKLNHGF